MKKPWKPISTALFVLMLASSSIAHAAGNEVNLYSERQAFLIDPLLKVFSKETGIKVNLVYMKKGMLERLKLEGRNSPADAILTSDIGNLHNHAKADLLQAVASSVLERNIPANLRDPGGLFGS